MSLATLWNQVTKTGGEQRPTHIRECEEEECATSESVDGPDGWPGKDEVDKTESPGCEKGTSDGKPGLTEDGGGIEGDNIDCLG
jgi:hypothetical protein